VKSPLRLSKYTILSLLPDPPMRGVVPQALSGHDIGSKNVCAFRWLLNSKSTVCRGYVSDQLCPEDVPRYLRSFEAVVKHQKIHHTSSFSS
jgi:hypothetical protein